MTAPAAVEYALLRYSTWNIGDEIQSLAARQFLPRVDHYLDRDRIRSQSARLSTSTKLIMNGWWLHGNDWPPDADALDPLLISMFLDANHPRAREALLSPAGRTFFEQHGPVGARDHATLAFLEESGFDAYFSGCLTLTLQRDPLVAVQDFVLAVDLPDDLLQQLRSSTARRVVALSTYHEPRLDTEARFRLAELYLLFYQSAAAVITTRLHALLPSLALETPALLVTTPATYDPRRFDGLADLARMCSQEEFARGDVDFDPDDPAPNPGRHLALREALIDRAGAFTGSAPAPAPVLQTLTAPENLADIAELFGDQIMKARAGQRLEDSLRREAEQPLLQRGMGLAKRAVRRVRRR
ncbi:polysaccharide pyruvyl transferase family protein [Microbacter sp. GSS18]|nr:polysaccharide pyruvyl transferase family protein [Microbacter sp. GSS18]